ncbi:MAG: hypothetical protein BMS9Abin10_0571 [Gammaproteobacteria bacterium]|nr:MAG: hypothetical protein BMS9Abin10_0571 [Gammaproteobacteria bacterium]
MIHLVIALPAESRPLIDYYRLARRQPHGPFPVYASASTALIVSGIGKAAAAAAVGHLQRLRGNPVQPVWLNVGVAGHGKRVPGEIILADRVTERATARSWYPPRLSPPPCASDTVLTVDEPEHAFAEPVAYDMEAAGFCESARRFSPAERVHCLKIVSDNAAHTPGRVTAKAARRLIEARLDVIDRLLRLLDAPSARPEVHSA